MAAPRCSVGRWRGSVGLRGALALLAVMSPVLCSPRGAAAASIVASSTADAIDGTSCTLRAAIIASNTQTPTGGCPAGTGNDTITLAPRAVYVVSESLAAVTAALTINGNGAIVTRSDATDTPPFRLFYVASGAALYINDLTITNGRTDDVGAGGILNAGTLTLVNSAVVANSSETGAGGGIINTGSLTLIGSAVSDNATAGGINGSGDGGGIFNAGMATLVSSLVSRNATGRGGNGGGIANSVAFGPPATLIVTNSTINDNTTGTGGAGPDGNDGGRGGGINNAAGVVIVSGSTISGNTTGNGDAGATFGNGGNGGGIANTDIVNVVGSTVSGNATGDGGIGGVGLGEGSGGGGGGIFNDLLGTLTVVNGTIGGNVTGSGACCGGFDTGGGIANAGTTSLASSTISENTVGANRGGGIANFSSGTFATKNSIIASNSGANDPDCTGTLTSEGYNLVEDVAGCSLTGDQVGDLIGQNPMLGPLQDNGGPTPTQALLSGSPAIDAGDPAGCTNVSGAVLTRDQRGAARWRTGDTRCDIGSYEFGAAVLPPCPGDCNDDGVVTVDEILVGVRIALGGLPSAACPAFTTNGSDTVTIDEILQAVNSALDGCP